MFGSIGQVGRIGQPRGSLLLYPGYVQDYLDRVTAADVAAGSTQGLERGVTDLFNAALQGMVSEEILGVSNGVLAQSASLIKAGCFVAGARTLSGALTPIAATMPAPTNFNFVSGDYNPRTGLLGDGSTKYLDSNRSNNSDPQNNFHLAVHVTAIPNPSSSRTSPYISTQFNTTGGSILGRSGSTASRGYFQSRSSTGILFGGYPAYAGFYGSSRSAASDLTVRYQSLAGSVSSTQSLGSQTPLNQNLFVFRAGASAVYAEDRLSFYSIGESLGLALLDARVTALMNGLAAVLP